MSGMREFERCEVVLMVAAVVLAGGASKRMGRDKLALRLDGHTMLESVLTRFGEEFENVYMSVADAEKYPDVKASRIVDILAGAGPMSGLHAALTSLPDDGVFLVAADLPYACPQTARRLIDLSGDCDIGIIRLPDGKFEPLFGFYRKAVLPLCTELIKSGNYRMSELFSKARIRFIDPVELGGLWDEKLITNINYPEDYEMVVADKNTLLVL